MAKAIIFLCLLLVTFSLCYGKNETEPQQKDESEKFGEKIDKRDKRQILKDIFTLYGGWKPILPGSPYYFGSQAFSGGLGGFSYGSPDYGGLTSSSYLGHPTFYIQAPTANLPRKNIYSYYPPPVIGSSYGRDYQPKPLYTERKRNHQKGHVNQLVPYQLGNLAAIDIRDAAKELEVVDLQVSVLPLGRGNLKHPIVQPLSQNAPNLHLSTVPIMPQSAKERPFNVPNHHPIPRHPQSQTVNQKFPIILPTIPVHPKQLPFHTISAVPHQLKTSDIVLTTHPLRPQVQKYPPPPPPSRPNNYRPPKQEELVVTVVSDGVDTTIQKRPDGSKEEIKVVPIEIQDGGLPPAAVVDEIIEIKDVPIDIVDATVSGGGKEKYSSSNKRPLVQYLSLSGDQIDKVFKGAGVPVEAELIYSGAENRGVHASRGSGHSSDAYKREEVVTLNLKPGQSVEDALLQLATESKNTGAQSQVKIDPSYENVEVVDMPDNDYLFSKRSEKPSNVLQRTTIQSQQSTTKTTQKPTTVSL